MDPNAVVLEISSDEEVGWIGHDVREITDGGDDHNWIAELLDEVNRDDCGYDGADDSDEVVLVSEVFPTTKNPRKKSRSKSPSLIDLDDDCVILDHDPDKPIPNGNPIVGDEDYDSDDLRVVSEKGQVACRDYPHPRHLCIKFPFSSTPNQTHCDQCYCYVCDSLAPCVYWGNGSASVDHCHATDKDEFWKLERQNSKNVSKGVQPVCDPSLLNRLNPPASALVQTPSAAHNLVTRPVSSNFGVPNIVNRNRSPFLSSRNKYQPGLVSQQLSRTNNCTHPRDRGQHNYNLCTPFHVPVFKRTGPAAVLPAVNRYSYSSYRDNYRNTPPPSSRNLYHLNEMLSGGSSQSNVVNTCGSFSPPNLTSSTEQLPSQPEISHPSSNSQFEFSSSFPPRLNSDSYVETPIVLQPHPIPLSSQPQGQSSLPISSIPWEAQAPVDTLTLSGPKYDISWPQNQTTHHRSSLLEGPVSPKYDMSWPESQTTHQSFARTSPMQGPVDTLPSPIYYDSSWPESQTNHHTNESSPATVARGMVDYEYDNWTFSNQGCEPGSVEVHGAFDFSPEPAFVDTGTMFNF